MTVRIIGMIVKKVKSYSKCINIDGAQEVNNGERTTKLKIKK